MVGPAGAPAARELPPPDSVVVVAENPEEGARLGLQLLTRYQHRIARRNTASGAPEFDQVLRRHRHLHDLSQLFVRADYVHALDTWQWVLRLEPEASLPLQIAALFHDVERPIVEPASRSEPVGPSYQALKDAHARAGARLTRLWLSNLDLDPRSLRAAELLIEAHERPATTREQGILNQADALSFISRGTEFYPASLLSWRLRRATGRLEREGLERLPLIRCAPEVSRVLEACAPIPVAEPELQVAALH